MSSPSDRRALSRRRLLRSFSRIAGAAALVPLSGACSFAGRRAVSQPGASPAARSIDALDLTGKKLELSFWHTQTGANQDKLNAIVEAFNASQPSVRINPEFQGNYDDLFKKLLAAVAARQMPDLAVSYPSMVSEYQAADAVVALDPYIANSKYGLSGSERIDFIAPYWKENQYPEFGNALLSFPFTKSLLVMYYNADRLKAAGITAAPENWTWEDYASISKRLSDSVTKGWAISVSASTFDGMVYSRGGRLISDDQKMWLFDQKQGLDSLTLHQDAVRTGWGYRVSQANGDQNDFAAGRAMFTLTSTAGFPFYQRAVDQGARFNWSVATIPHTEAQPATVLYGASTAVFRSSPERQLGAWLFLKHFASPDVTADWSVASGYMPVRASALQSEAVQSQMRASPAYKVAVTQIAQFGRPETSIRGTQDTRSYIEDAITKVITDPEANAKAALDDAARKGQQALLG